MPSGRATGASSESFACCRAACGIAGTRRSQRKSASESTMPGAAAIHVRSRPNTRAVCVANIGPSAQPSVPPVTQKDIAMPRDAVLVPASEAVCGWNAATPMPPATSSATSAAYVGAAPMLERNTAATSGPAATNHGRDNRSDSSPNNGCENDEDIEPSATRLPTIV
ncbi:MAG: hypothetical protein IPJ04_07750 [Candidatus Eisenbacteria bacterium]|nr:hypothetical protein [Candidatus Eisenbacteria bacterium]